MGEARTTVFCFFGWGVGGGIMMIMRENLSNTPERDEPVVFVQGHYALVQARLLLLLLF